MNVDAAIQNHRAVKHFDPGHTMTKKAKEKLLATALLSPAAGHVQNWHFVVVDDPEQRKRIREACWDQEQVTDAAMLIILCANLKAWEMESMHYWRSTSVPFREFIVPTARQSYRGLDRMQRDEIMRSCGIVAQTIMLVARSMGYAACPMDGFDFDAVADFINLPDDYAVCMFLAVGKSLEEASPPEDTPPINEVVIRDSF